MAGGSYQHRNSTLEPRGLPITPTDLFPREFSEITKIGYPKVKITFDISCLVVTAVLTFFALGHIKGLGIGTIAAAFTMGKAVLCEPDSVSLALSHSAACDKYNFSVHSFLPPNK